MNQKQTEAYIRRIQNGDSAAFKAFYEATSRQIYFICISFLKNEHDTKDVMQETYLTAFRKLHKLRDTGKAETWLKRIAVNKCRDHLKQNMPVPTEDEILEAGLPPEEELVFSEEYITNAEKRSVIMEILRTQLSDLQYQTIILFYFNQLSIRETAEVMECTEGAVKNRLGTARRKIKKGIEEYEQTHHVKLHAGIPLLTLLLHEEAKGMKVPDSGSFLASEVLKLSGKGALKTAERTGIHMIKGKLIAGTVAAAIAAGGAGTATVLYVRNHSNPSEPEYQQAALPETSTEARSTESSVFTETTFTEAPTTAPIETTTTQTPDTAYTSAVTTSVVIQTESKTTPTEAIASETEPYEITKEAIIQGYRNTLETLCSLEDWKTYGAELNLEGVTYQKPFTIDPYLCDMTHDGIPELAVVCATDMMTAHIFYYTFDENGVRCFYAAYEPSYATSLMYDTQNKQLVKTWGHFGIYYYHWLAYENGRVITTQEEELCIIREDKAGTEDYYDNAYWEEWEAERHLEGNHFYYDVEYDKTVSWYKNEADEIIYTETPGFDFSFLEAYPF